MNSDQIDQLIERALAARDVPSPPPHFTAAVMARVVSARMQTERVFDLGFNLAMAAGILVILSSAAGLGWSLGLFTITIDTELLRELAQSQLADSVMSRAQSIVMAAAILTMTLVGWWWAETGSQA